MSTVAIDSGCALLCIMAHESTCHCRCGGVNHGKAKIDWPGLFCEGCDKFLGDPSKKETWAPAGDAYCQTGRSKKYVTKNGVLGFASWCEPCYWIMRDGLMAARG